MNLPSWELISLFLLVPICTFLIIFHLVALIGGWSTLARAYRLQGNFAGKRWRFQDLTLRGWFGYSGGVTVGANAEGLYLGVCFRIGHPPLFFPWVDLTMAHRELRFLGFRFGRVEFTSSGVPGVRFAIGDRLMAKIAAELGPILSDPRKPSL